MSLHKWMSASLLVFALAACASDPEIAASECVNELTPEEQAAGWRLLFDGKSLAQWRSYQEEHLNSGWAVENGCLTRLGWGQAKFVRIVGDVACYRTSQRKDFVPPLLLNWLGKLHNVVARSTRSEPLSVSGKV